MDVGTHTNCSGKRKKKICIGTAQKENFGLRPKSSLSGFDITPCTTIQCTKQHALCWAIYPMPAAKEAFSFYS